MSNLTLRNALQSITDTDFVQQNWKISPIHASSFAGLAPALIVTAEMDVLRDEGEAYGAKMNGAGSEAEIIRVKGAPHSFSTMDEALEIGSQYNRDALRALGRVFGRVAKTLEGREELKN
jgi:acetyl esterase/lipase